MMGSIGLSIVADAFRDAYFYVKYETSQYLTSRVKAANRKDAFLFISGTGLDLVLHAYGCEYDAEALRNGFFTMINRRDLIQ